MKINTLAEQTQIDRLQKGYPSGQLKFQKQSKFLFWIDQNTEEMKGNLNYMINLNQPLELIRRQMQRSSDQTPVVERTQLQVSTPKRTKVSRCLKKRLSPALLSSNFQTKSCYNQLQTLTSNLSHKLKKGKDRRA